LRGGSHDADSPLVTAVIEYAQRLSEPYLLNHAMRSWLFAEAIGRMKGIDYGAFPRLKMKQRFAFDE
jgi:hypothetical protein